MRARLIIAWVCNLVDVFSTLYLCENNYATEINPFMACLLTYPILFVVVKISLITVLLIWLWRERNSIFAAIGSYIAVFIYGALALYYLVFITLIH